MEYIQIRHHIFLYRKLTLKIEISQFMTKVNQTMELKQNQTFFRGTNSNNTKIF